MSKKITLIINKDGSTQIQNVTGAGQDCVATSNALERMLGVAREETRQPTQDMYIPVVNNENQQQI